MYYIILTDKRNKEYDPIGTAKDKYINNAYHFKEYQYFEIRQNVKNLGWTFIKILDDGTKVEMP